MLVAFLLVRPVGEEETARLATSLRRNWKQLENHEILDRTDLRVFDHRETAFLEGRVRDYVDMFYPCMRDVALMLHAISRQVAPSYALMETPPPRPEHLHEAMQRIILNYLVEHADKDIELDPSNLRSTKEEVPPKKPGKPDGAAGSSNSRKRTLQEQEELRRSKRVTLEPPLPPEAITGFPYPVPHA